jgi:hypothetical protein
MRADAPFRTFDRQQQAVADFGEVDHAVRAKAIMRFGGSRSGVSLEADHSVQVMAIRA